jgi:hypothetical protein
VTLVLAGAAVGSWALFATAREAFWVRAREPAAPAAPVTPAAATVLPPARGDTLAWTIQLAAYGTIDKALAHADRLGEKTGLVALVTPVLQNNAGTVWYRVLAGSYPTREAAVAARKELWRRGAAPRGIGDLLRAPYSFALATGVSIDSLRARGLPAVRGPLLGAFETPEQAAFTEAALTRAGVRATLLPRVGTTP